MITLDPEFVGSLAPPSKLTTAVEAAGSGAGAGSGAVPFARLPRLERLRVSGKADETEVVSDGADDGTEDGKTGGGKRDREEREKRKMRGKGKSLKRCVFGCCCSIHHSLSGRLEICSRPLVFFLRAVSIRRYLRKQRKNVIDPKAVSPVPRRLSRASFTMSHLCSCFFSHCFLDAGRGAREAREGEGGAAARAGGREGRAAGPQAVRAGSVQAPVGVGVIFVVVRLRFLLGGTMTMTMTMVVVVALRCVALLVLHCDRVKCACAARASGAPGTCLVMCLLACSLSR